MLQRSSKQNLGFSDGTSQPWAGLKAIPVVHQHSGQLEMSSFLTLFWWPQSRIYRSFLYFWVFWVSFGKTASLSCQGQTQPHVERESSLGTSAADISASPTSGFFSDRVLRVFLQASLRVPFFLWPLPCLVFQTTKATALNAWLKTARKVSKGRPATISVQGKVQDVIRVGSKDKHDPWHKTTKQPRGYMININWYIHVKLYWIVSSWCINVVQLTFLKAFDALSSLCWR